MGKTHKIPKILRDGLSEHPACRAWRKLYPGAADPQYIEVLHDKRKASVYNLAEAGPGGGAIVAKRAVEETFQLEKTVYEEILPHLPITAPRYYGCVKDEQQSGWLFLEHAGSQRFCSTTQQLCLLAAEWLALLHGSSAKLASIHKLPDRGASTHLQHLRLARDGIVENLPDTGWKPEELTILKAVVLQFDELESTWDAVDAFCHSMPSCFVHGDFKKENIHVRSFGDRTTLLPVDWEMAGHAMPAVDLLPFVDRGRYASAVRMFWPGLNHQTIEQLKQVGQVLRSIESIYWTLPFGPMNTSMGKIELYLRRMADSWRKLAWVN